MATNLQIDDKLLKEAVKLGGFPSKKAAVNEVLRDFVQRKKQLGIVDLFGKIDFDPGYDHKKERRRSDKRIPKWES
jgi:hypothetical protein